MGDDILVRSVHSCSFCSFWFILVLADVGGGTARFDASARSVRCISSIKPTHRASFFFIRRT